MVVSIIEVGGLYASKCFGQWGRQDFEQNEVGGVFGNGGS